MVIVFGCPNIIQGAAILIQVSGQYVCIPAQVNEHEFRYPGIKPLVLIVYDIVQLCLLPWSLQILKPIDSNVFPFFQDHLIRET